MAVGEHGNRAKTTLQPSTGLFKESKPSGSPLAYPCHKPLRVCLNTHLCIRDCSFLPDSSTWGSCAASARTVEHSAMVGGVAVTLSVCRHRDCSGCLLVTHALLMPFKPVGSSVFGPRGTYSVDKFSICAFNCSWQEFGRGMRLSKFPAQLGQCTQMLPWGSSCPVPPGQHTGTGQPAHILLEEFSLGGLIFSLFIHLDQIPELLN